jgi:hypothetical protein
MGASCFPLSARIGREPFTVLSGPWPWILRNRLSEVPDWRERPYEPVTPAFLGSDHADC